MPLPFLSPAACHTRSAEMKDLLDNQTVWRGVVYQLLSQLQSVIMRISAQPKEPYLDQQVRPLME